MGNVVSGLAEDSGDLTADLRAPQCFLSEGLSPCSWVSVALAGTAAWGGGRSDLGAGVRQTLLPAAQHGTRPETSVSWLSPPEPYSRQGISVPFWW